jgi:hypothetical protein
MQKENSSCVPLVLLFVDCMSVCDREEGCSWEEKGGVEVEKKEFFCCLGGAFLLQKDEIRSRKENKVRSK